MEVKQALFVELLGGIGDLIFALPSIEALKRSHPAACLDVLTFAPGGELLVGDPRVHQVFFARRERELDGEPAVRTDVKAILDAYSYDLIVCDTRHSGIHELVEASSAVRKVTQLWTGAGRDEPIPRLFIRRLTDEGIVGRDVGTPPARIYVTDDERQAALAMWSSLGVSPERVVVFNPHSGVVVKCWPAEYFVTLGHALTRDGWTIAVLAGDGPDLSWKIARGIPGARFLPKLSLRLTAACLEGTALMVSGDSGIAHLASAVGASVLAVFGPTWAGRYGVGGASANLQSPFDCPELNVTNFTLQRCWCNGNCIFPGKLNCCEDVTPGDALAAARRLLESTGA